MRPSRTRIICVRWQPLLDEFFWIQESMATRSRRLALDTTGSSVIPVGQDLAPLDDYYLWCDHRAKSEAAEITDLARRDGLEAIAWCGGVYSSEWGFAKLLHWLRHNPAKRDQFVSAFEHCDMVAATLCGIADPHEVKRSVCAMGHKWMWNASLGGLPPEEFLRKVDPLLTGIRAKLDSEYRNLRSDRRHGYRQCGRNNSAFAPGFRYR